MKTIGILAGEASGDLLGAALMRVLSERFPNLHFVGIGGPAMIKAGCQSLFDIEQLSVMGFFEPLRRLPQLIKMRSALYHYFIQHPPDIFIGIDSPDFNLGLEKKLHDAGIPTVHYVSPSVWAWRRYRIHKIKKAVDLMLTLFPFEKKFYDEHHVPACYVGHPLANAIPIENNKIAARQALQIDEQKTYVALLPGSRSQEIKYMAKPFLLAAKRIHEKNPNICFLTSHVNAAREKMFNHFYQQYAKDLPLLSFIKRSHEVLAAADVAMVTSGTATLEAMLFKKPMVIAYCMSTPTYWLAKRLVKSAYIGLPNLLANDSIVPELIQHEATPDRLADCLLDYFEHPENTEKLIEKFTELHHLLRLDSSQMFVDEISRLCSDHKLQ